MKTKEKGVRIKMQHKTKNENKCTAQIIDKRGK